MTCSYETWFLSPMLCGEVILDKLFPFSMSLFPCLQREDLGDHESLNQGLIMACQLGVSRFCYSSELLL